MSIQQPPSPQPDPDWQRVHQFLAAGQPAVARTLLHGIVARNPEDVTAHLFLCGLDVNDDRLRDAVARASLASAQVPPDASLLGDVIAALLWLGEIVEARRLLDSPIFAESMAIPVLMRAAGQRQEIGDHAQALELMERAGAAGADGRDFLFHHAVQLGFNGQLAAARSELERCTMMDPPLGRAFVQLARMQHPSPTTNHLTRISNALEQADVEPIDHAALEFARFEELQALHRHTEAWAALQRGNTLMHAILRTDSETEARLFQQLIEICSSSFLRPVEVANDDGPQPIFVIGMPRSGTTLLERILGNHSQIASGGELGDFPRALTLATNHYARQLPDETVLARLPAVDWREVGRLYLGETRWRAGGKRFYVDKLPRNWMLAGLIRLALPHARIVHVKRDPMDLCFSNWRAFFGPGAEYAYAYDLEALARHHETYCRVMNHWHRTLPGQILDVDLGELTRDSDDVTRRVLGFCGLDHEPGCTNLARNRAPSATLSMSQIRESIGTGSPDAWKPYAAQLAGLRAALEAAH